MVPHSIFLTKGVGRAKEKLESFENALRNARIANFNLVRVSSIFPPRCKIIPRSIGLKYFSPGEIVFCVMSDCSTNEPNRLVAASVGLAIPKDRDLHGYLSEHHAYGQTDDKAGDYAEDLAAKMLATTLGIPFDEDKSWDERRKLWKLEKNIVRTTNVTQSAIGAKDGRWTTVVAAAILITEPRGRSGPSPRVTK
ncbi:MAG: arginine decarboxylase, pyruvoyl-dependent [Candidatus Hydrogenedentota bacterium]|nr:MAG: arginine decarboxylase, pyruvoyl-dependent [Candidatus Hydrogenedentota bacterium]